MGNRRSRFDSRHGIWPTDRHHLSRAGVTEILGLRSESRSLIGTKLDFAYLKYQEQKNRDCGNNCDHRAQDLPAGQLVSTRQVSNAPNAQAQKAQAAQDRTTGLRKCRVERGGLPCFSAHQAHTTTLNPA